MFMNNSSNIVGIVSDDDDEKFLIIVNNYDPERLASDVEYPHVRFYELESDFDNTLYQLINGQDLNTLYIV